MGWWKSLNGMLGDGPADIMDKALKDICRDYQQATGRNPTQGEIADLLEFCTGGALVGGCGDAEHEFDFDKIHDDAVPRARERGFQGAMGPSATCDVKPGQMVNVDPETGQHCTAPEATEDDPDDDDDVIPA